MVNRTLVRDARSNHVPRCTGAASGSRCARPKTSMARSPVAVTTPRAAPEMRAGTARATEPVAAARISAAVTAAILLAALWRCALIQASADGAYRSIPAARSQQLGCIVSGILCSFVCARRFDVLRSGARPERLRAGSDPRRRGSEHGAEQRAVRRPVGAFAAVRPHALRAVQPRGGGGDRGAGMAPVRPASV